MHLSTAPQATSLVAMTRPTSMQRPPFDNDCYTKAVRTCGGSFPTPLWVGAALAILWSFGTKPPPTASRVFQVVRWTLRRNRRQWCLPSVDSKWATVVPVASTEGTAIGQPSTGTEVVPNTWTALVLSTAEALLDSEDKTTMERIYIVVYAKKTKNLQKSYRENPYLSDL